MKKQEITDGTLNSDAVVAASAQAVRLNTYRERADVYARMTTKLSDELEQLKRDTRLAEWLHYMDSEE